MLKNSLLFKRDIDVLNHSSFFTNGLAGILPIHRTHVHALIRSYALNNLIGVAAPGGGYRKIPNTFVVSATTRDPNYNTFYRGCIKNLNSKQKTHVLNLIRKYMRIKVIGEEAARYMAVVRAGGERENFSGMSQDSLVKETWGHIAVENEARAKYLESSDEEDEYNHGDEEVIAYDVANDPHSSDHREDSSAKRVRLSGNMFAGLNREDKVSLGAQKLYEYQTRRLMKENEVEVFVQNSSPYLPTQDDSKNYEYPPYNWTIDDPEL